MKIGNYNFNNFIFQKNNIIIVTSLLLARLCLLLFSNIRISGFLLTFAMAIGDFSSSKGNLFSSTRISILLFDNFFGFDQGCVMVSFFQDGARDGCFIFG